MSKTGKELGERIRELRKVRKMSQEELAYKAGISPAHLGQIERALKNPTIDTIDQISRALDVPLSDLFRTDIGYEIELETSPVISKINIHLSSMNEHQLTEILRLIRIVKNFNDFKN